MRVCVNCHKGKTFIETIHMRCQDKKLLKCLFILIFHKPQALYLGSNATAVSKKYYF